MDAPTTPGPSVAALPTTVRSMGATLATVLGISAMGLAYVVSEIPVVESALHVRYILGPDGVGSGAPLILAWAVAPIAAAAAGWIAAPRALIGRQFAGVWMGFLAYAIAIAIAPIVVFGPMVMGPNVIDGEGAAPFVGLVEFLVSVPFIALLAGLILAPLLVVCVVAGTVWAGAVRWAMRGAADPGPQPAIPETDIRLLIVMGSMLGVLWFLFAVVALSGSFGGGEFID